MRVYTRGENQSLAIGDGVIVTVLQVFPDHIRVGIRAPHREYDDRDRGDHDRGHQECEDDARSQGELRYWETDLFLPESLSLEGMELELSFQ